MTATLQKKIRLNLDARQQALLDLIAAKLERSRPWVATALVRLGLGTDRASDQQAFQPTFGGELRAAAAAAMDELGDTEAFASLAGERREVDFMVKPSSPELRILAEMAAEADRSLPWMATEFARRGLRELLQCPSEIPQVAAADEAPQDLGAVELDADDQAGDSLADELAGTVAQANPSNRSSLPPSEVARLLAENIQLAMMLRWGKCSYKRLATDAGLGGGTTHRMKRCEGAVAIDTLAKVAKALSLEPWRLLAQGLGVAVAEPSRNFSDEACMVAGAIDAVADPRARLTLAGAIMELLGRK